MVSDGYVEHTAKRYEGTVKDTAQVLRDIADDFERAGLDLQIGSRSRAAGRALHTLQWGLANASIERLFANAVLADEAERESREEATGTDT